MIFKKLFLVYLLLLTPDVGAVPRGIRQNNPGNIRATYIFEFKAWPGAMGVDDDHYITFKRKIDGIRAIVINLRAYSRKHRICTPRGIVTRWTYREAGQRVLDDYTAVVCTAVGPMVRGNTCLNLEDPKVLESVTRAIIFFENGADPYSELTYKSIFPRAK